MTSESLKELVIQYPSSIAELLDNAFTIEMNANDFFGYACADSVRIDIVDLEWVIPIVEKYPNDGINAVMSFIREQFPLPTYQTKNFKLALDEIRIMNFGKIIWSREYV